MNLIAKITDDVVGEKKCDIINPTNRYAVRTILINNNGEIALLHKTKKNEYKLIGGGIEENEDKEQALKREALEESGCEIQIEQELGYTMEFKSHDNFIQTSYIYISKVVGNTNELHLTEQEFKEGSELCWFTPEMALEKILNCYENLKPSEYSSLYSSKFIIKRDSQILKYYIKTEINQ